MHSTFKQSKRLLKLRNLFINELFMLTNDCFL